MAVVSAVIILRQTTQGIAISLDSDVTILKLLFLQHSRHVSDTTGEAIMGFLR
jgi:hypothetical protein